ncbi:halocyanin domain-containing protein [Halobacteriales archaeon QS_9_68_42]|nr:MAG: halocyanin domain-containing protein [Halobacteriales archaeon QS_9_68_42]
MSDLSRRWFLRGTSAALAVGTLAGCTGNGNGPSEAVENHLSDAKNYEGSLEDMTGENDVTIDVGAGPNGYAFDPAAVRISSGTTVIWEWTGKGGAHNVASVEGSETEFDSGESVEGEDNEYEQSFDSAGSQLYICEPHKAQGMKGAIEVVEE